MPELAEIKKMLDEQKSVWEEFKKVNDERAKDFEKLGVSAAATEETLGKMNERMDTLETEMKRPNVPGPEDKPKELAEELERFEKFVRQGVGVAAKQSVEIVEKKALATDSLPDGGNFVIPEFSTDVISKLREFSPIRSIANVRTISQGNSLRIPADGATNFAAGWVGERAARPETVSGTVRMVEVFVRELEANPFVTQNELDDAAYNVIAWLSENLAESFAVVEGSGFVNGDNVLQPEGFMTVSGITEVDSGDANLLTADGIITLHYTLPEPYARDSTYLARRLSIGAIRKFKGEDNQYLWQPGLMADQPATLLGRPIIEAIDMPTVAAGNFPLIFGNFNKGYYIVDKKGLTTMRDPFTNKPFVEFYTTKRTGGKVALTEAFVKQKVSA